MAQLNEVVDSLQNQVTIDQLKSEVNNLKREVNQLKLENNQFKQNGNLVNEDNDRRFNSLNGEVNNLKSRILDNLLQTTSLFTSEHVNKRICQNQTEQITDDYSQVDANKIEFSSLPDDAISLILIRIPLRYRVLLRIICHRWKSIIESMCLSVRSLKLFGPTTKDLNFYIEVDRSRPNLLLIDMKRDVQEPNFLKGITNIQFIPQLFCNVDRVLMRFPKTFEITIMLLLESWADRLTGLVLDIDVGDQALGEAIWHRITQMPKLESLAVYNNFKGCFNPENSQFLGKLRDLQICTYIVKGDEIIRLIGPNIRRLELRRCECFHDVFRAMQNRPTLLSNVTHFNLATIEHTTPEQQQEMFQFICLHFVSLIDLQLDSLLQVPFDQQLTHQSRLAHLTKLHLYMTRGNLDRDLPRSIQFASLQSLVLNIWMKLMTPKQTRLRPINITERTRIVNFFNSIPSMFPVLTELEIMARNNSTVKMIQQFVNGSALKLTDRIKCEVIGV